jgi:hypothetical protein
MSYFDAAKQTTQQDSPIENPLSTVLTRLSQVLREENARLEAALETDHTNYIAAKNQALRELMVMQRSRQLDGLSAEATESLRDVRKLVDRNSQLLKLQVTAMTDLTSFLTQSAISDSSDGTYTREQQ